MEEELNYITTSFESTSPSRVKPDVPDVIYDEVKVDPPGGTAAGPPRGKASPGLRPALGALAAALGVACVALASVLVGVSRRCDAATAQGLALAAQLGCLERRAEQLARDRDRLNWTLDAILRYQTFPVSQQCPQKVCRPCEDDWKHFQSHCYWFRETNYFSYWTSWEASQKMCKEKLAELVVIESPEEQEFVNNHTEVYKDSVHGYWMGLTNKNPNSTWMWIDGSNLSVEYWDTSAPGYKVSCALTLHKANPWASWRKTSCEMKNRLICEKRALIKSD